MSQTAAKSSEKSQAPQAEAPARKAGGKLPGGLHDAVFALQRTAGNQAVTNLLGGRSGKPLDGSTRREMESKFGADFGPVRVHTGEAASASAELLGANAWTSGRDIAFAGGRYSAGTREGKKLLAHELAHVVQQSRGGASPQTFDTASPAERDATRAAEQLASPGPLTVSAATGAGVARDEAELPWWKKRLNPIYQRALEVLPKDAADKLKEANAAAKGFVQKSGIGDENLNKVTHAAEPVLQPLATALGVKDSAGGGGPQPAAAAAPGQATQSDAAPSAAPSQTKTQGTDSESSAAPKPDPSSAGKQGVGTDYPADPHAFSGVELAYTAEPDDSGTTSPGVHKSQHYWLAPQLREGKVVSYVAYNPEMKRNEYVIGPDQVQTFMAHEELFWYNAAASYPIQGDPREYKALSGRVAARAMQGDLAGAFKAWKESWKSASKDPNFWIEATMATADAALPPAARPSSILGDAARRTAGKLRNTAAAGVTRITMGLEDAVPAVKVGTGTSMQGSALYAGGETSASELAPRAATAPAPPVIEQAPVAPAPAPPVAKPAAAPSVAPAVPTLAPTALAATQTSKLDLPQVELPGKPANVQRLPNKPELFEDSTAKASQAEHNVPVRNLGQGPEAAKSFAGVDQVSKAEFTQAKAYTGPSAIPRILQAMRKLTGATDVYIPGSQAAKSMKDIEALRARLAARGETLDLPPGYDANRLRYIRQETVFRIADDLVEPAREELAKQLQTQDGAAKYGLSRRLTEAEAKNYAARRIKPGGMKEEELK